MYRKSLGGDPFDADALKKDAEELGKKYDELGSEAERIALFTGMIQDACEDYIAKAFAEDIMTKEMCIRDSPTPLQGCYSPPVRMTFMRLAYYLISTPIYGDIYKTKGGNELMSISDIRSCPRKAYLRTAVDSGIIKAGILRGIVTVSYTHLDVYKRQHLSCAGSGSLVYSASHPQLISWPPHTGHCSTSQFA